jgi:hypothetical protein
MVVGSADPSQPTEIRRRRNESDPTITESPGVNSTNIL